MKSRNKFWWFVVIAALFTLAVVGVMASLFWRQLSVAEKAFIYQIVSKNFAYLFAAACFLFVAVGLGIDWIFRFFILPLHKISEEIELIYSVNPSHRVSQDGDGVLSKLAEQINRGAEKFELLEQSVSRRIQTAKSEIEEEKNILAAIMAELPDAVLICNQDGQVILYNSQAKRYFGKVTPEDASSAGRGNGDAEEGHRSGKKYLGIGRSIFGLIDTPVIRHALDEIQFKLQNRQQNVISRFVVMAGDNRLLRAEAVPIMSPQKKFSGFTVILSDITSSLREEYRSIFLLRRFFRKIRHSVASIRSAIEIIQDYPQLEAGKKTQLNELILKESKSLGELIDRDSGKFFKYLKKQWPLIPIATDDFLDLVSKKARHKLDITLKTVSAHSPGWVKVDTYSMGLAILILLNQIKFEYGIATFSCKHHQEGDFANIDIMYAGESVKVDTLKKWETLELSLNQEGMPIYLKEVLDHHEADIWTYADPYVPNQSYLRLYLPVYRPFEQEAHRQVAILTESRPEMYDFDLFNQPGQNPDLDHRELSELSYTIFDTETTGLNPREGDKIISIGAFRIVNMRLLQQERFDHLVNPERSIPSDSTRVHGIDNQMVSDQPTIDVVLPAFHRFAEDTILVAHNAAFDMRMLQMVEKHTGVKFINPVMDTLLLSAVVHPLQDDHSLEAIAMRLGVEISHRHSAIGDALITGQIFLKLIPLLERMGMRTLKEAREASKKTYYARLKY
jgi:DNA polymerase-3 subunit epsilon